MNLHCPNCDTLIPAQNINVQQMVAVCPKCSTVFNFASEQQPKRLKRKVKAPENIKIEQIDDTLIIRCSFVSSGFGVLIGIAGAVGCAGLGFHMLTQALNSPGHEMDVFIILLISFFFGGVLLWWAVASSNNVITLKVAHSQIYIQPNQLTLKPAVSFSHENIVQFYVSQQTGASRYGTVAWFALCALTNDGENFIVMDHIQADQAIYLENVLEDYLGIEDMPVRGEY